MNTNKRIINYMSNHNHTEHSNFRLKDCIIRAKDLVDRAIELGYHGVSVTDHETLSAHVQIMQRYQELKSLHKKYKQYIEDNDMDSLTKDKDVQKNLHLLKVMHDDFKLGLGNEIYLVDETPENGNGTYLNGSRLPRGGAKLLSSGDQIRLGNTTLEFFSIEISC